MSSMRRTLSHLKSVVSNPLLYYRTLFRRWEGTDKARWEEPSNLRGEWDERTAIIAGRIPPGSTVIEFGAARLSLPRYLAPGCQYQPVDLVARSPETLVFDLNGELPPLPSRYDYAVFSGVLEYVADLDRLFSWLKTYADHVIFSYATLERLSDPITRRQNGWINAFSEGEIAALMQRSGLNCRFQEPWKEQLIFTCAFAAH